MSRPAKRPSRRRVSHSHSSCGRCRGRLLPMTPSGACARMRERHPQGAGVRAGWAGPPCSPVALGAARQYPRRTAPRPSSLGGGPDAGVSVEIAGAGRLVRGGFRTTPPSSAAGTVLHRGIHRRYLPATRAPGWVTRRRPRGCGRPSMCAAYRRALGDACLTASRGRPRGVSASHEPCDGSASRDGRQARREPMSAWRCRWGRCITVAARFPRFERASHGCRTMPRGSRSLHRPWPPRPDPSRGVRRFPPDGYLRRGSTRVQPARRVTVRLRAVSTSASLVTVSVSR